MRTRLVNCYRIDRRNDPRYPGNLDKIAGDLDIYLNHRTGREAILRPRKKKPNSFQVAAPKKKVVKALTGVKIFANHFALHFLNQTGRDVQEFQL